MGLHVAQDDAQDRNVQPANAGLGEPVEQPLLVF
jgi:hypothetical protein